MGENQIDKRILKRIWEDIGKFRKLEEESHQEACSGLLDQIPEIAETLALKKELSEEQQKNLDELRKCTVCSEILDKTVQAAGMHEANLVPEPPSYPEFDMKFLSREKTQIKRSFLESFVDFLKGLFRNSH
jgi:hypothetical protein